MKFSNLQLCAFFAIAFTFLAFLTFTAGYLYSSESNKPVNNLRSYQIEVYNDSTVIFDGNRHVITLPYDSTQAIDSAISADNQ